MAIQLRTVETEPFEWVWPENSDVRMMLRPLTPGMDRKVSRVERLTMGLDGTFSPANLADHLVVKAHAVIESWEGIEHGGEAIAVTRDNVQWLADEVPAMILAIIEASESKYAELLDLAGKSMTPPSGLHSEESTASTRSSTGTPNGPRAVSGADAA